MNKNHNRITPEAKEMARKTGKLLETRVATIRRMIRIRADLRSAGKRDTRTAAARIMNEANTLRSWYRTGSPDWNRDSVQEAWVQYFGESWRAGAWRLNNNATMKRNGLSWSNTPGYLSAEAKTFCQKDPFWTATTLEDIIELINSFPSHFGTVATAQRLNEIGVLRPNYNHGTPRWTDTTLATFLKRATGKTYTEIRKEAASKNQLELPVKTTEGTSTARMKLTDVPLIPYVTLDGIDYKIDPASMTIKYDKVVETVVQCEIAPNTPEHARLLSRALRSFKS